MPRSTEEMEKYLEHAVLALSESPSRAGTLWANITPSVQRGGLSSFRSNVHGAQEYMAASPLQDSLRSLLIHLKVYVPATVGNTNGHLGAMEQPYSIPLLWSSNYPALIFLFQAKPQRVVLTKVWQRECHFSIPRCGARTQTQRSRSSEQCSDNSNGKISVYSSTAVLFRRHSRNTAEVSGYLKLIFYESFKCQQEKNACRIREHCWNQT